MQVVQVGVPRPDFADTLGKMREWLDRNDCSLVRFETKGDGETISIKVRFDRDDLAEAFRQAFAGSYSD